jgi:23S rRNA (uracil1939-C5)-methyltransferase
LVLNAERRVGQVVTLSVQSLAFGGEGVCREDNLVIFVRGGVIPGETVQARIVEHKKNFARAELVQVVTPSASRVVPPCPYFQRCGGCQYQHLSYEEELRWKSQQVQDLLERVAKILTARILPIVPSPEPYGYRNRASVHASDGRVGFHRAGTHEVVDIEQCLLCLPSVNEQLTALRRRRPVDGHYSLRAADIPPSAFFQTNARLNETLIDLVKQSADGFTGVLVEGYAGGGFFTRTLAGQFTKVICIENDPRALRDAHRLDLPNVEWVEGKVEDQLAPILRRLAVAPDLILLDPPREGLGSEVVNLLNQTAARRVIYVSCDPSTMARDASKLKEVYRLTQVQPIDLFPRTAQIETITVWEPIHS